MLTVFFSPVSLLEIEAFVSWLKAAKSRDALYLHGKGITLNPIKLDTILL